MIRWIQTSTPWIMDMETKSLNFIRQLYIHLIQISLPVSALSGSKSPAVAPQPPGGQAPVGAREIEIPITEHGATEPRILESQRNWAEILLHLVREPFVILASPVARQKRRIGRPRKAGPKTV